MYLRVDMLSCVFVCVRCPSSSASAAAHTVRVLCMRHALTHTAGIHGNVASMLLKYQLRAKLHLLRSECPVVRVCSCACVCIRVHIHVRAYLVVFVCVTCGCVFRSVTRKKTHSHTCTHTHTHIHAHTHTHAQYLPDGTLPSDEMDEFASNLFAEALDATEEVGLCGVVLVVWFVLCYSLFSVCVCVYVCVCVCVCVCHAYQILCVRMQVNQDKGCGGEHLCIYVRF